VTLQAYVQGLSTSDYRDVVDKVRAVLFLSTPHNGAKLAEVLNWILSVSIFGHSAKQYISELQKNSPTIIDINEGFRSVAGSLDIYSFYETLETPLTCFTSVVRLPSPGRHDDTNSNGHR